MANALSASDVVRQVKWVRNELVAMFVERHPSYVQVAGCHGHPALLNLPTAILPETNDDTYRAARLLHVLDSLLAHATYLLDTLDIKSKEYKMVSRLFQRRSPFRPTDGKIDRLYSRQQIITLIKKLRKRYANRGRV